MIATKTKGMLMMMRNAKTLGVIPVHMEVRIERTLDFFTISIVPEGSALGYMAELPEEIKKEIRRKA